MLNSALSHSAFSVIFRSEKVYFLNFFKKIYIVTPLFSC